MLAIKKTLLFLPLCFWACSGVENGEFIGQWIEQISGDANYVQGFDLKKGGQARSIGMQTLQYHGWTINDGKLILSGESIGNGQTCPFDEILEIVSLRNDTLLVKRKGHHVIFVRRSNPQAGDEQPSRKPYEGFVWRKLSGAGLTLWAQENAYIRLIADSSLPGIVMVREGDSTPHPLIRIFDLPDNDINDIIETLSESENWDKWQTCQFEELKSGRKDIRRFVLRPSGDYAAKVEAEVKTAPVPATCNGWGIGNSGMRYFEIHASHPDKAVFVEIGQDAPLFDENSIMFSNSEMAQLDDGTSLDELYTLSGRLCIGHEVRTFVPDGRMMSFGLLTKLVGCWSFMTPKQMVQRMADCCPLG